MKKLPYMSFSKCEKLIIQELVDKTLTAIEIVDLYQKRAPNTPRQTVYQGLRKLVKNQVIIGTSKKGYSLSHLWIQGLADFASTASPVHQTLVSLSEGDKISFSLSDMNSLDLFWDNSVRTLLGLTSIKVPLFFINPHQWFFVLRPDEEKIFWKDISAKGYVTCMCVPNVSKIDTGIGVNFFAINEKLKFSHTHVYDQKHKSRYYSVIGDYCVIVDLPQYVNDVLDGWYKKHTLLNTAAVAELTSLIKNKNTIKLTVQHNAKLAHKIRTSYKKYFYI